MTADHTPEALTSTEFDDTMLMLHEVPSERAMTAEQRAGHTCVWCGAARTDLVDLGSSETFRPHACPPCRAARLACLRSFSAWRAHVEQCPMCALARCGQAEPLARAHHEARRQAGKEVQVWCVRCSRRVHLADRRIIPCVWLGESRVSWFYVHSGPCPATGPQDAGAPRRV
jgi:hypothetical protein